MCTGAINSSPEFSQFTNNFTRTFANICILANLVICIGILIAFFANEHIRSKYQDCMRNLFLYSSFQIAFFQISNILCDHIVDYINIPINNIFIIFAFFCFLIYDFADYSSILFLIVMSSFYISCENELKKETEKNVIFKIIKIWKNHISKFR